MLLQPVPWVVDTTMAFAEAIVLHYPPATWQVPWFDWEPFHPETPDLHVRNCTATVARHDLFGEMMDLMTSACLVCPGLAEVLLWEAQAYRTARKPRPRPGRFQSDPLGLWQVLS